MRISRILEAKGTFVATVPSDCPITELLSKLAEHRIGAVLVVDGEGEIRGMASERDVVRALNVDGAEVLARPVASLMTDLVATCTPSSTIEEIAVVMTENRVRHVPVLDDEGKLLGIVSIGDVVKARIDQLEHDRKTLIDYITS
ncbi:MAG: CBS domain-containing protein [Candidatus Nanopelagicales bacterium]|nr:CBS domain-containing protein [Candidatus Nanopelagicales bacterium]